MTPMFDHGPNPFGTPRVFLAGVGPAMTRVAGEVADGFFSHGFTTPDYFRDVTVPNLQAGLAAAGRTRADIEVSLPLMAVVKGADLDARIAGARTTLSFYGSTPAYRGVLEHHGWEGIGEELTRRSKEGDWAAMGEAVTDEMLETFTIIADEGDLAGEVQRRYGAVIDRLQTALDPGIVRG
jgi:probable F420-dependent oxidoreductase